VHWQTGDVVALRYITTDRRVEMTWPCRVVRDTDELVALFIAAGSIYRAGPKRTAAQKLQDARRPLPSGERVWRNDTLRLLFPGARHSVALFWEGSCSQRRFLRYFVNLEEPFRRTAVGFDTQDHTLDVVVTPELECTWRDEAEFDDHVRLGFFTAALAAAVRAEARRTVDAIRAGTHPCLHRWDQWAPDARWPVPALPARWATEPPTSWELRDWAYGTGR
jgi:hypothetical protein